MSRGGQRGTLCTINELRDCCGIYASLRNSAVYKLFYFLNNMICLDLYALIYVTISIQTKSSLLEQSNLDFFDTVDVTYGVDGDEGLVVDEENR